MGGGGRYEQCAARRTEDAADDLDDRPGEAP